VPVVCEPAPPAPLEPDAIDTIGPVDDEHPRLGARPLEMSKRLAQVAFGVRFFAMAGSFFENPVPRYFTGLK